MLIITICPRCGTLRFEKQDQSEFIFRYTRTLRVVVLHGISKFLSQYNGQTRDNGSNYHSRCIGTVE
jgi:hypothetical protein